MATPHTPRHDAWGLAPISASPIPLDPVVGLTVDEDGGWSTRKPVHAEDPNRAGYGLCGVKLRRSPTGPAGDRCIVCRSFVRLSFVDR